MTTLKEAVSAVSGNQQQNILYLRSIIDRECPLALKALRLIDQEYTAAKRPKGYSLAKRDNKKTGFVYYVRYWHEGKIISSKWCTHTNNYDKACEFAEQNRERLIAQYLNRNGGEVVRFLDTFYDADNPVYKSEIKRSRELSEEKRKRYQSVIKNKFIPFIKEKRIREFDEITVPILDDFQDTLLAEGLLSKSVNDQMVSLSRVFNYLTRKGQIKANPYLSLPQIPTEARVRGCHDLSRIEGVFNEEWEEKISYLLNLIIYTTDMRNIEIKNFCKKDIVSIDGYWFIDLKKSKTVNGIRLVPLHNDVYRKIMGYAKEKNIDEETPIFGNISKYQFQKAAMELGKKMKMSGEQLKEEKITFYSGRHYWKTLMNAGELGEDAEEIFMGHKVKNDVSKRYNHRDKQGKELIVKKTKKVHQILDKKLFARKISLTGISVALRKLKTAKQPQS